MAFTIDQLAALTAAADADLLTILDDNAAGERMKKITLADLFTYIDEKVKLTTLNAQGAAPCFAARAWVSFDGGAVPTIFGNGNFSAVSRVGAGIWDCSFEVDAPDTDYAVVATAGAENFSGRNVSIGLSDDPAHQTVGGFRLINRRQEGVTADTIRVNVAVFY
jgi:hypothetical protein